MMNAANETMKTPCQNDLALTQISNNTGLSISRLPNGNIFAIEHKHDNQSIMINQTLALPIEGGMSGILLRVGGEKPENIPILGYNARYNIGATETSFVWEGNQNRLSHRVTLTLQTDFNLWLWKVIVTNERQENVTCDIIFIQDLGLGDRGFLMNNEAYASQYIDHYISHHPHIKNVLMARQNQAQSGKYPWTAHGCLEGSVGFATDFRQFMGPAHRDSNDLVGLFGNDLPSSRLQYETACAALQSHAKSLRPHEQASWTFFSLYEPDHPAPSSDDDLSRIDGLCGAIHNPAAVSAVLSPAERSIVQDAKVISTCKTSDQELDLLYPEQMHVERLNDEVISLFVPSFNNNRHIVLRNKERVVARRHGALIRSGNDLLPNESTLCVTCWMHGVFAAQLTIANTSFHKLFSVSRDPYNITRSSGLRILVEIGGEWKLLSVPTIFDIGLSDCRWVYYLDDRKITISAVVASDCPAIQWRIRVEGVSCRFLIYGHLVLGEHEFAQAGNIEINLELNRFSLRPESDSMWGKQYPNAVYHMVVATPEHVADLGGDELLYHDGRRRSGAYVVMKTSLTDEFVFSVVGSMTDESKASELAQKYSQPVDDDMLRAQADAFWGSITRGVKVSTKVSDPKSESINTILPWLAHDAIIHLTVPHGLEQYTGAAWGTRDVCQGPIELFLSYEHDTPVKEILRILFAQQYEKQGDWPQWFMLEPYSFIQDKQSHGDVIVWPLKALCDYLEATGDLGFLDETVAWRCEDNLLKTDSVSSIASHIDKLLETVCARFIPGTSLIRYGNGDWNDALQPVDASKRDWMVSSWTVALLYQQICRYDAILRRKGLSTRADELASLAQKIREEFNAYLICDGVVAGYGVFRPEGGPPDLLIHPSDKITGIAYSLIPMTQAILGGLFTQEQISRHLELIKNHLLFADGARLMDKPTAYHGGLETIFRRAESSSFFGREIGLMYTHSHLRYAEAMSAVGESKSLWDALCIVNPISVTEILPQASLRQRNTYFSSSDAAFADRYQASEEWDRAKEGTIKVDGGWRIYSSGPGVYTNILIQHALGMKRSFGKRIMKPMGPSSLGLSIEVPEGHAAER